VAAANFHGRARSLAEEAKNIAFIFPPLSEKFL
jgi:hypothetical protein